MRRPIEELLKIKGPGTMLIGVGPESLCIICSEYFKRNSESGCIRSDA